MRKYVKIILKLMNFLNIKGTYDCQHNWHLLMNKKVQAQKNHGTASSPTNSAQHHKNGAIPASKLPRKRCLPGELKWEIVRWIPLERCVTVSTRQNDQKIGPINTEFESYRRGRVHIINEKLNALFRREKRDDRVKIHRVTGSGSSSNQYIATLLEMPFTKAFVPTLCASAAMKITRMHWVARPLPLPPFYDPFFPAHLFLDTLIQFTALELFNARAMPNWIDVSFLPSTQWPRSLSCAAVMAELGINERVDIDGERALVWYFSWRNRRCGMFFQLTARNADPPDQKPNTRLNCAYQYFRLLSFDMNTGAGTNGETKNSGGITVGKKVQN